MSVQILQRSGFRSFLQKLLLSRNVMHFQLAWYMYLRSLNFPVGALRKEKSDGRVWLQNSGTLAIGTQEEIDKLIEVPTVDWPRCEDLPTRLPTPAC